MGYSEPMINILTEKFHVWDNTTQTFCINILQSVVNTTLRLYWYFSGSQRLYLTEIKNLIENQISLICLNCFKIQEPFSPDMPVFYWVVDNSILNLKRLLKEYVNGLLQLVISFHSFRIYNFIFLLPRKSKS